VDERIVGQRVKQFLFRSSPQTRLSFGNCFVCPETPEFDVDEWERQDKLLLEGGALQPEKAQQFITAFLSQFSDTAAEIWKLSAQHHVAIILVYRLKYVPFVGLTREHVDSIAALGARVDFDIMADTIF
jgi:hypothetical protein